MMKLAVLAAVAGSAAAFAPSPLGVVTRTHLNADAVAEADDVAAEVAAPVMSKALPFLEYPANLAGYTGDVGFDPFRFSDFAPMDFLREAELKHGRIAMMAWLGFCATDCGFHIFPFPEAYEGLTSVSAHDALVEQGALSQMFLWFGLLEIIDWVAIQQMLEGSGRQPGDFGLDPSGFLKGASDEVIEDMKLKEITHCRLGMLAFSGVVTQAVLTQGPFPYV